MILFEILDTEDHPVYQRLEAENGARQYDFLLSVIQSAIDLNHYYLSSSIIKALNGHAIACLHVNAGEYRPCHVTVGDYEPPYFFQVEAKMNNFINQINRLWDISDPLALASFALWRLNHIHPFINGNGRTARAVCYFILCMKLNMVLPGAVTLPELLRKHRGRYVQALKEVDASNLRKSLNLTPLHDLISELLIEQIASAQDNASSGTSTRADSDESVNEKEVYEVVSVT